MTVILRILKYTVSCDNHVDNSEALCYDVSCANHVDNSEVLFDNHVDNSEVLQALRIMLIILKYS